MQFFSGDVGHHIVGSAQCLKSLVHADNVRVVEACQRARLLHKALQGVGVVILSIGNIQGGYMKGVLIAGGIKRGQILLNNHLFMALQILCQVGNTEPALTDFAQQTVMPQLNTRRQG